MRCMLFKLRRSREGSSRPTPFAFCCCCLLGRSAFPSPLLLSGVLTVSGRRLGAAQDRTRRITASCPPERSPEQQLPVAICCRTSTAIKLKRSGAAAVVHPGWVPPRLPGQLLPASAMASSTLRSRTQAGEGVLPIDTLYEILIRLPVKDLCRLRAVCRPWRSLLSDPQFIAAHATRHRRPLIVAGHDKSFRDDGILCDIIDLSGRVIKQIIRSTEDEWLISTQRNLACIAKGTSKSCQLLNLVTGDRFSLPEGLSQEHTPRKLDFMNYRASVALGQVASTGEFKLLRVIDNAFFSSRYMQLCEVFTFGGSGDARWRGKKAAQDRVDMSPLSRVVIDGVVYFLLDEDLINRQVLPKGIASFDLLTEEWRSILRGPVSIPAYYSNLSLAALNGSLVLVHCMLHVSMDLWFLVDTEKNLWVRKHTVEINLSIHDEFLAHPLVILKNGSIVTYIGSRGLLRIYNPRINTYTDVAVPCWNWFVHGKPIEHSK